MIGHDTDLELIDANEHSRKIIGPFCGWRHQGGQIYGADWREMALHVYEYEPEGGADQLPASAFPVFLMACREQVPKVVLYYRPEPGKRQLTGRSALFEILHRTATEGRDRVLYVSPERPNLCRYLGQMRNYPQPGKFLFVPPGFTLSLGDEPQLSEHFRAVPPTWEPPRKPRRRRREGNFPRRR